MKPFSPFAPFLFPSVSPFWDLHPVTERARRFQTRAVERKGEDAAREARARARNYNRVTLVFFEEAEKTWRRR